LAIFGVFFPWVYAPRCAHLGLGRVGVARVGAAARLVVRGGREPARGLAHHVARVVEGRLGVLRAHRSLGLHRVRLTLLTVVTAVTVAVAVAAGAVAGARGLRLGARPGLGQPALRLGRCRGHGLLCKCSCGRRARNTLRRCCGKTSLAERSFQKWRKKKKSELPKRTAITHAPPRAAQRWLAWNETLKGIAPLPVLSSRVPAARSHSRRRKRPPRATSSVYRDVRHGLHPRRRRRPRGPCRASRFPEQQNHRCGFWDGSRARAAFRARRPARRLLRPVRPPPTPANPRTRSQPSGVDALRTASWSRRSRRYRAGVCVGRRER
jgi:hypothetical protein